LGEVLGVVHTHGRGLLQGWWWALGPKLVVLDQMAAQVPEITDGSLYEHRRSATWDNIRNGSYEPTFATALVFLCMLPFSPEAFVLSAV
jgi:hypothetical protein